MHSNSIENTHTKQQQSSNSQLFTLSKDILRTSPQVQNRQASVLIIEQINGQNEDQLRFDQHVLGIDSQQEERMMTPSIRINTQQRILFFDKSKKFTPSKSSINPTSSYSVFSQKESLSGQVSQLFVSVPFKTQNQNIQHSDAKLNKTTNPLTEHGFTAYSKQSLGLQGLRSGKSACIKKKTMTFRQNDQGLPIAQEAVTVTKSMKKVAFKGSNEQSQNKKDYKSGSITSICLNRQNQDNIFDFQQPQPVVSVKKSTRVIHDQGNNNLVYKIIRPNSANKASKRDVACSYIQVKSEQQQLKEMQIFKWLQKHPHAHILPIHSLMKVQGGPSGRPWLQMTTDFYPRNLQQYIEDLSCSKNQAKVQRKIILYKIVKGIAFLHHHGIAHRDISPTTILLTDKLDVVITGCSSFKGDKIGSMQYSCSRYFRAPQVVLNAEFGQGWSRDMWAIGCIIVCMLTGQPPFQEPSQADLILQMIKITGRPSKEDLQAINYTPSPRFIFPKMPKFSLSRAFRCEQESLLSVLKSLLVFNPFQRARAIQILANDYFAQLRDEQRYKQLSQAYQINDLFTFGDEIPSNWRRHLVPNWSIS